MQQRLDLCTSAVKLLKDNSSLTPLAAAESAYQAAVGDDAANEERQPIINFVQAQMSEWMEMMQPYGLKARTHKACIVLGVWLSICTVIQANWTHIERMSGQQNDTSCVAI